MSDCVKTRIQQMNLMILYSIVHDIPLKLDIPREILEIAVLR